MAAISNASGSGNGSSGIPSSSNSSSSGALTNTTTEVKEKDSIWYFTSEQLANSPSRRHGISPDQELSFRQMTAYLIQEMGQRLQVSQLCINTAIVYMHRFYAFHSFTHFSRNGIASASLFLAAKVEEQPRKLEHVIKASQKCQSQPPTAPSDANYNEQAQDLVFNENVLLQTLGFDVAIDHPHTHVVKTCHLVKACKDLAQTSYFLASNSLHLTSMCLQYRPTVVACFCIYLACKWSRWEIPQSTEGKHWFHYVDKSVTMDLLKQLTDEFIAIYEKSPARLKSKLNSIKALAQGASNRVVSKDKKSQGEDWKMGDMLKLYHSSIPTDTSSNGGGMTMDQQVQQYQQMQQQEQMQQQQQQQLPPPPTASQQPRRSESHSSHHRTHHSSSHHHSKQILPPNEMGEHKPVIHKQPYPPVGRQQRDLSQPYPGTAVAGHSSSKQMQPPVPPAAISSRSSSAQGRPSIAPVSQIPQRPPPQAHDPNYHKSSRSSAAAPSQLNPPAIIPNHKIMSKSESSSSRMLHKDATNRPVDLNKMSNKTYPSTSVQNVGVDMTRSMLQQNVPQQPQAQLRPYNTQNSTNAQAPPPSTHPSTYTSRTSSISNSKYDQQLSVQMQQQQQLIHQQQQKQQQQPVIESSYNPQQLSQQQHSQQYSRQQIEESYNKQIQQPPQMQQSEQMELCSPPKYSQYTTHGFVPTVQQQQQAPKQSSIFSPDYNDKLPLNATNNGSKIGGHKTSNRDSPKKSDRSTPKKDKNRSSSSSITDVNSAVSSRQLNQVATGFGIGKQLKQEQVPVIPPPYGATGYGVVKRPSSSLDQHVKTEDELRDSKVRKLELNAMSPSSLKNTSSSNFSSGTVNGIETNPDLVSSLLKESLCSSIGYIKTEDLLKSEYQDPMQFFDPTMTTLPEQILQSNPPAVIKEEQVVSEVIKMEDQTGDSLKSEKKKKKDKHKHKEKDKSKDKEERKKHKKDKDRHKDRERGSEASETSEPVKIKISKDKFNLSTSTDSGTGGVAPMLGFTIKIPKDRISGDLSVGGGGINFEQSTRSAPPPPLKIKISKDKLDSSYSSVGNMEQNQQMGGSHPNIGSNHQHHGGSSSTSSSSSSKKKDRDRDRDREKDKKRSHDHSKMNGSASNGGGSSMGAAYSASPLVSSANTSTNSSSKGQISNKIHQQYNSSNMSHLFGESNDDDDDDDDSDNEDIGISPKLPPAQSFSHHKSKSSSHGSSRYSSADNRYNSGSSSGANTQQKFNSQHRRQSSSSFSYQKNNNNW